MTSTRHNLPSLTRRGFTAAGMAGVLALIPACSMSTHHSLEPLSPKVMADLAANNLKVGAPLLVRIFKEENEMEVWLQQEYGPYVRFRTYQICSRSGVLGPKFQEGDRQAPEGFYIVSQRQMNPNSKYYLSFNIGYPNAFDKAHGRTGTHLMVHGGLLVTRLLCDQRRAGAGTVFAGARSISLWTEGISGSRLSVPHERAEPAAPCGQPACSLLA